MISKKKNFLFIRIPKSAGRTMDQGLMPYYIDYPKLFGIDAVVGKVSHHATYWEVKNNWGEYLKRNKDIHLESLYKFAFVRNPWDRVFSYYYPFHRKKYGKKSSDDMICDSFRKWISDRRDFMGQVSWSGLSTDFLANVKKFPSAAISAAKGPVYRTGKPPIELQQVAYMTENGCFEGENKMDFIGRFENLEEDVSKIEQKLGVKIDMSKHIGRVHGGSLRPRRHYSFYYDEESIDTIEQLFYKDIELFDYSFERQDS